MPRTLTVNDFASAIGVSYNHAMTMIRNGVVSAYDASVSGTGRKKHWRIDEDEVHRFKSRRSNVPAPASEPAPTPRPVRETPPSRFMPQSMYQMG